MNSQCALWLLLAESDGERRDEIPPSLPSQRGIAWKARHAHKGFLNMHEGRM